MQAMPKITTALMGAAAALALSAGAAYAETWDMPVAYADGNFHTQTAKDFAQCVATGTGGELEIVGDHVGNDGNGWFWAGPAWIAGLVVATALVGFYISMIGFFLAFLKIRAKASWPRALIMTACAAGFILGLAYMLSLNFPSGWLQSAYELPWPFR